MKAKRASSHGATITRSAAIAARRGRPWMFREAIVREPARAEPGTLVDLVDEAGEPIARALWDPSSAIAARVVAAPDEGGDVASIYTARVRAAIARRDFDDRTTTAYRLVNGEGDRAPGLVVDRYAHVAVVRLDTPALERSLDAILRALDASLGPRGVRSIALRRDPTEKGASRLELLAGEDPPETIDVLEHGVVMEVDLARGQKTGAFLDQRENRARVRALAAGKASALNLFSYAGGFSIAAALGGAKRVVSVDVAAAAHATAQRTFRKNGVDPSAHAFATSDVFAFLEGASRRGERFELVVSDPPSFAPSERAKERALAAYRKLHAAARAVLAPGGVFCAASCSSHVSLEDFLATLDDAAIGRGLSVVDSFNNPSDHPTLAGWPEGRYLKMVVLR